MWGGIQTGWLRHAHLIDSDLHSIPIPGSGEACSSRSRLARSLQRSCLEGLVDWQPVPTDASGRLALSRGWFAPSKTVPKPWPADQRRLVTAVSAPPRPSASDSRPKLKDGASASDRSAESPRWLDPPGLAALLASLRCSSLAQYVLAALTSFEHARQRAPTPTTRPGARACASRKPRDPGKGRAAVRAGMKGAARSIYPGRSKHRSERSERGAQQAPDGRAGRGFRDYCDHGSGPSDS